MRKHVWKRTVRMWRIYYISAGVNWGPNQPSRQGHCQFPWKGMKGWCPSWISQDITTELFDYEPTLFFKTREEWPKRQFRDCQGCLHCFKRGRHHLDFNWPEGCLGHWSGTFTWQSCGCRPSNPVCLEDRALSQWGVFSSLKISWSLLCQVCELLETHHSLFTSTFSLLEWNLSPISVLNCFTDSQLDKIPLQQWLLRWHECTLHMKRTYWAGWLSRILLTEYLCSPKFIC